MSYNNLNNYNNLYNLNNTSNYNNTAKCCDKSTVINNYYNNYYNNNKELIRVDTSNNYYLNITLNDFNKIYDLFIVNCKSIYLPIIDNNLFVGFTIKIINSTGSILNIYSQDNQLIYSNLYLPKQGSISAIQNPNSLFVFCAMKKNDFFCWIMI